MYTVSRMPKKTMFMTIDNQHPNIELVSPVHFCNCGEYYEYPVKRTDDGVMMNIRFIFGLGKGNSRGILTYKVQRNAGLEHQSSIDPMSAKIIEEALKRTRLLITWEIEAFEEPKIKVILAEYENESDLDEDKLEQLYEKFNSISNTCYKSTFFMYDNTALEVEYETVQETSLESKLTISEASADLDTVRSMWIESER
jgi:hypothetical protein